jgi:NDP-sugar pyrophosphorylase family protein
MILAAGLGTRLRPLSELRPKPAMPVRGIPLVAYNLALLARHGVTEVAINLHHLPGQIQAAAERYCPPGVRLHFSIEDRLLDTGGGIRRLAGFLRESDPSLLLAGDMVLDADLTALVARHRGQANRVTMLLCEDSRAPSFGTLGVDGEGRLRRIAQRLDLGGETRAGVWVWANAVSPRLFESMPDQEVSVFLHDWVGRLAQAGASDVRAVVATRGECLWEPVGTREEYLRVNLEPPPLSYIDPEAMAVAEGARFEPGLVVGGGAIVGEGTRLERAVVWDGEVVPAGTRGSDGVFAGGAFHRCREGT